LEARVEYSTTSDEETVMRGSVEVMAELGRSTTRSRSHAVEATSRDGLLGSLKSDVTWIKWAIPGAAGFVVLVMGAFFGVTHNNLSVFIKQALIDDAVAVARARAEEQAGLATIAAKEAEKARKSAEAHLDAVKNRSVDFMDEGTWESNKDTPRFQKIREGSGYRPYDSDFIAFKDKIGFTRAPNVILEIQRLDISGPYRFQLDPSEVKEKGFKFHLQTWGDSSINDVKIKWTAIGR
jgi:hypothetical protein